MQCWSTAGISASTAEGSGAFGSGVQSTELLTCNVGPLRASVRSGVLARFLDFAFFAFAASSKILFISNSTNFFAITSMMHAGVSGFADSTWIALELHTGQGAAPPYS